jgi:hypothetical protein
LILLNESNTGVKKEKSADNTEIDPILQTSSENSGGFLYVVLVRCHDSGEKTRWC